MKKGPLESGPAKSKKCCCKNQYTSPSPADQDSWQQIGDVLRRVHLVRHLYRLGERPTLELLNDLDRAHGIRADIDRRLERYVELEPDIDGIPPTLENTMPVSTHRWACRKGAPSQNQLHVLNQFAAGARLERVDGVYWIDGRRIPSSLGNSLQAHGWVGAPPDLFNPGGGGLTKLGQAEVQHSGRAAA